MSYNLLNGPMGLNYNIVDVPVCSMSKQEANDVSTQITEHLIDFAEYSSNKRLKGLMPCILVPWIGAN